MISKTVKICQIYKQLSRYEAIKQIIQQYLWFNCELEALTDNCSRPTTVDRSACEKISFSQLCLNAQSIIYLFFGLFPIRSPQSDANVHRVRRVANFCSHAIFSGQLEGFEILVCCVAYCFYGNLGKITLSQQRCANHFRMIVEGDDLKLVRCFFFTFSK